MTPGGDAEKAAPAPPRSEAELAERARSLGGETLAEIAARARVAVPETLERNKGFVGTLLERALGADAGSRDEPDFRALGIELKTLPVDRAGKPRESTFVCSLPLASIAHTEWHASRVARKLARVLFVAVEAEPDVAIAKRRVGASFLWSPDGRELDALAADWDLLSGMVGSGRIEEITAHLGACLQVRPKAAHSRVRTSALDADGDLIAVNPRGFYLRATFTRALLERALEGR